MSPAAMEGADGLSLSLGAAFLVHATWCGPAYGLCAKASQRPPLRIRFIFKTCPPLTFRAPCDAEGTGLALMVTSIFNRLRRRARHTKGQEDGGEGWSRSHFSPLAYRLKFDSRN